VANLAVDCIHRAVAVNELSELTELESLDLGVYEGVPIDILGSKNFFGLKALSLSESKGRKLDLSPLSRYANRTALDFERVLSDGLPRTLEKFNFYSLSSKQDKAIHEKLASLGLWAKGA